MVSLSGYCPVTGQNDIHVQGSILFDAYFNIIELKFSSLLVCLQVARLWNKDKNLIALLHMGRRWGQGCGCGTSLETEINSEIMLYIISSTMD